ncbi:MAG TPA: hypothetical protein VMR81_03010 [Patescibacteria group bacterium]|nr:hypothetical protein [Patescibacteria group bacterium]
MNISISSTLIDFEAYKLVTGIIDAATLGELPGVHVSAVISTREVGDDARRMTDLLLTRLMNNYSDVPLIMYSAKQHGRIKKNPTDADKNEYDTAILKQIREKSDLNIMAGDMVIKGSEWCNTLPSLNLHPDLPLSMGGREGVYWNVIGTWVREKRKEIGGMMHLAIPTLDAGTPIAYFRLPAKGIINGINLSRLWDTLPTDHDELEKLIQEQTSLKDKPTHPLFTELRQAEAAFEPELVIRTIGAFAEGRLSVVEGKIIGTNSIALENGLDLTEEIVGDHAIWPGNEGTGIHSIETRSPRREML